MTIIVEAYLFFLHVRVYTEASGEHRLPGGQRGVGLIPRRGTLSADVYGASVLPLLLLCASLLLPEVLCVRRAQQAASSGRCDLRLLSETLSSTAW